MNSVRKKEKGKDVIWCKSHAQRHEGLTMSWPGGIKKRTSAVFAKMLSIILI